MDLDEQLARELQAQFAEEDSRELIANLDRVENVSHAKNEDDEDIIILDDDDDEIDPVPAKSRALPFAPLQAKAKFVNSQGRELSALELRSIVRGDTLDHLGGNTDGIFERESGGSSFGAFNNSSSASTSFTSRHLTALIPSPYTFYNNLIANAEDSNPFSTFSSSSSSSSSRAQGGRDSSSSGVTASRGLHLSQWLNADWKIDDVVGQTAVLLRTSSFFSSSTSSSSTSSNQQEVPSLVLFSSFGVYPLSRIGPAL